MSDKNRIIWIDLCKCIAIFYMIWGHTGIMPDTLLAYVSSFHMPIFFFLSGYIFSLKKDKHFSEFIVKKFKTLIIPYLFFGLIACLYCLVFISKQSALETLKALFTVSSINFGQSQALWFLPCIFITELMFYLIVLKVKNNKSILCVLFVLSLLGYSYSKFTNVRLLYSSDIALTAIVFYGLGYIVKNSRKINVYLTRASEKLYLILFMFILDCILSWINGITDMRNLVYNNYFLYYFSAISGILSYILLFIHLCTLRGFIKSKVIKSMLYFGRNTLILLVLNEIVISFYRNKIFEFSSSVIGKGLDITFLAVLTFIPIIYIINKYLYFILGKPIGIKIKYKL